MTAPAYALDVNGEFAQICNSGGGCPASQVTGSAICTNFVGGQSAEDVWNTAPGYFGGFRFHQLTGTGTQSTLMTLTGSGNAGIGTSSPLSTLQVVGTSTQTNAAFGTPGSGVFDILGLTYGGTLVADISSNLYYNSSPGWNLRNSSYDSWMLAMNVGAGSTWGVYHTTTAGVRSNSLTITPSGNVGIGAVSSAHLLEVAGTIGAAEVVTGEVVVTSRGYDYVFDPDYRLAPPSEVSQYIKQNNHLPDIPSAKEVQQKGMGLGEMQGKLLAKVEELTLHMIQADERNNKLEAENCELRSRIERLEAAEGVSHEKCRALRSYRRCGADYGWKTGSPSDRGSRRRDAAGR